MSIVDSLAPGQVDPFADLGESRRVATLLRQAMGAGHVVAFDYDGKSRVVEVHAIGHSTKDNSVVMRGYMPDDARPWRLFSVLKIEDLGISTQKSEAPREGYAMADKQMSVVLSQIRI